MPKSRGSSTIANRSSEQTYDEQEMSRRIEERLEQSGPITVDIESRTRGGSESVVVSFGRGTANVDSASGNTYSVDYSQGTCTCPDNLHRQNRCRHIEAVDIAREQIAQGTFAGAATDPLVNSNQTIREQTENERRSEIQNHQRIYTDDDFFYTENPEMFQQDMENLRAAPVPYYYENVLNGAGTTFGVELEFVDGDSDAIAAELYGLGICGTATMQRYHSTGAAGKWKLENDGSVTSHRGGRGFGGELISPVLTDTPETWRQIEVICEVARRHGAQVSTRTGGHVHIGVEEPLDGKKQRWRRFFKMAAGFEETLFRLSGGERGQFRGGTYAASSRQQNLRGITASMPREGDLGTFQRFIGRISGGKYSSINVSPFQSNKKTVEFRAFNGTLTPGIIQANVKFSAGLINSANRSRTRNADGITATSSDRKRGNIINQYETNNRQDDTSIMRTLDAVFSRKEDKEHILSVIAKNSWRSLN